MWNIFNLDIKEGSKIQTYLEPYEEGYKTPATIINGRFPGKTILVTAGIHSCEWVGTPTTIRIAQNINPELVHGKIILLHIVNVTGFWNRRIRFMPEDGGNLNDIYPIKENDDSLSNKIAKWLDAEIMPNIDAFIDLHTGAPGQDLRPLLFFPLEPNTRDLSFEMAKCINVPYLIESRNHAGPIHQAAWQHHVPALILERGCGGFCHESWVQEDIDDCMRVFKHLGIYDSVVPPVDCKQYILSPMEDLLSDAEGIWYPAVAVDQKVKKGQLLGHLEDVWGNLVKEYYAQEDGVILYYTTALPIKKGHMLVSYGAFRKMYEI